MKTSYLNEEVNCTEPSRSVGIPCTDIALSLNSSKSDPHLNVISRFHVLVVVKATALRVSLGRGS